MVVCICHRVSDRDIAALVASGCTSFDELQLETGAATACGCCLQSALETFEAHRGSAGGWRPRATRCGTADAEVTA
jgi:bacterioferritin-associated ferredoxin